MVQQREHARHPGRAAHGQPIGGEPSDQHDRRAECQRLDDVRTAAHAAVERDRGVRSDFVDDLRELVEGCGRAVELASAVVRDIDGDRTGVGGRARVLGGEHALHDERNADLGAGGAELLPCPVVVPKGVRTGEVAGGVDAELGREVHRGHVGARRRVGPVRAPAQTDDRSVDRRAHRGIARAGNAAGQALEVVLGTEEADLRNPRRVRHLAGEVLEGPRGQLGHDGEDAVLGTRIQDAEVAVGVVAGVAGERRLLHRP